MMSRLLAVTATLALLSACDMLAGNRAGNETNASANAATANTAVGAANPLGAPVSGDRAKEVMHERHEGMEDIGDAMKLVSTELKNDSPDLAKVREGAATFDRLVPLVKGWYPPGTGPDVGKTRAKAEIWQKPEDFAAKARNFEQTTKAFSTAAAGSDVAAIKAAHAELGKSCKACHDLYRTEKKEHD